MDKIDLTEYLPFKEEIVYALMESYLQKEEEGWPVGEKYFDDLEFREFSSKDNGETLIVNLIKEKNGKETKKSVEISVKMEDLMKNKTLNLATTMQLINAINYIHKRRILFMTKDPEKLFNEKKLKNEASEAIKNDE